MSPTAIVLLLLAAAIHVAWNVGGKAAGPTLPFFRLANTYAAGLLLPATLAGLQPMLNAPGSIWLLLLATGFFQALYFAGLSGAYLAGHLSIAYPLARAWPALFVVAISFARGHGDSVASQSLWGISLILVGSAILPLPRWGDLRFGTYIHRSTAFAALAALGTTGYTVIDDAALRTLHDAGDAPRWLLAAAWLGFEAAATVGWLAVFSAIPIRKAERSREPVSRRRAMSVAVGISATYLIVLVSYTFVSDVSYVAAFRQISVPLGAIAGIVLLREPSPAPRLVGVSVMFAGLVLVALG